MVTQTLPVIFVLTVLLRSARKPIDKNSITQDRHRNIRAQVLSLLLLLLLGSFYHSQSCHLYQPSYNRRIFEKRFTIFWS